MSDTPSAHPVTYTRSYGGYMFWSLYVIASVILLALGSWQVARHIEKSGTAHDIASRLSMPPAPLIELLAAEENAHYRQSRFKGIMLYDHTVYLYTGPMTINGRPGYDVITPAYVPEADVTIAVNRGWIDEPAYKSGGVSAPEHTDGLLSFDTVILPAERQGTFTPDNDDANNIWFWVDTAAIAARVGAQPLPVFATLKHVPDALKTHNAPIPREIKPKKHLPHAGYAVTWYSFFVILTIIVFKLRSDTVRKKTLPA